MMYQLVQSRKTVTRNTMERLREKFTQYTEESS